MLFRSILGLVVAVAVIFVAANSLFTVDERQKAIMFEFGEIVKVDFTPGIHLKVPVMNNIRKFDDRILTLDSEPELYLTLAKKNVIVDSFVKWRIKDVARFFTANSGDEVVALNKLSQIVRNGLRDEFGKRTIQETISGERNQIMEILKTNTLILTTNVAAVHQWIEELKDKTHIPKEDIGEYVAFAQDVIENIPGVIEEALSSQVSNVRAKAIQMIEYVPEEMRSEFLERALGDVDSHIHKEAISVIKYAPKEDRAEFISRALSHNNRFIQEQALLLIERYPAEEQEELIKGHDSFGASSDDKEAVRLAGATPLYAEHLKPLFTRNLERVGPGLLFWIRFQAVREP